MADAPVTIVVYGDYECPYTRGLELALARLRRTEPNAFRSVYRHFPLREIHPHAETAAGVNAADLREALESRRFADRVERDVRTGTSNGVDRTPSIFINGERYLGPRDTVSLRKALAHSHA